MKRNALIAVAFAATITAGAQNIAVVCPGDTTSLYQSLDEAIKKAKPKSIIYLPGGGLTVSDSTKIDKQLTIMGVSHRGDTDNADGATVISGNLNFVGGSSRSAVMGVYLKGDVYIGTETDSVTNFTLRYCNVNSVQVKHSGSTGMIVNNNYIRSTSFFGQTNPKITNNIAHSFYDINGGQITNNVITSYGTIWGGAGSYGSWYYTQAIGADNSIITYNVLIDPSDRLKGSNCYVSHNLLQSSDVKWATNNDIADDNVELENIDWGQVFKNSNGVLLSSNYKYKEEYMQYSDIGIYGGSSFNDKGLAPIPRIVSKEVDEQTDGTGKLTIKVKVVAQ